MNLVKTTRIFSDPLRHIENNCTFAVPKGMYGFDSKSNCHVSMPSLAVTLVNLDCKKVIGENNYALAA